MTQDIDKEIQALRKQKACVKGKLTKLTNFAKTVTEETTLEEIQSRLDRCHGLLKEFSDYDMKIIMLKPDEDGDLTFEDDYHMTVARLTTFVRKRSIAELIVPQPTDQTVNWSTSQFNIGAEAELKLPKINIPKFTGNYTEWPSFYLYSKTIHESKRLSQAQKFQYLKGLLDGEAAALLRHILVTENNYTIALAKLQDRYDRKRHIVTAFIKKFMSQPSVQHSNAGTLRRMMDTSHEVVRGLEAWGKAAEARDPWLIYVLLDKLDDETRTAWAHHSTDVDDPKFSDFLKFLTRRIDALETATSNSRRIGARNEARTHITTHSETTPSTSQRARNKCAYCSSLQHSLLQCNEFISLDVEKRRDFIHDNHRCYNCLSMTHPVSRCSNRARCHKCGRRHHTLLHSTQYSSAATAATATKDLPSKPTETQPLTAVCSYEGQGLAVLPTVSLQVENSAGGFSTCRALLDSGSQLSLITNSCVQRLNLLKEHSNMLVSGVGHNIAERTKGIVKLKVKTGNELALNMVAFVLPRITCRLPTQPIDIDMNEINSIKLADPTFNKQSEVDILIGSDVLFEILLDGTRHIKDSQLLLKNTVFGWVIVGKNNTRANDAHDCPALSTTVNLIQLDATLKKFWEAESVGNNKVILSPEETLCEEHFVNHTTRDTSGRFIVKLPFKTSSINLGNKFNLAMRRFQALERRFSQQPEFKDAYTKFMKEYISLGHMSEVLSSHQGTSLSYYLPHHGVLKSTDEGNKLRVVFDGSAQPYNGKSLNSCLAVGPTIQASLFNILLRFREKKYVFSADIEKMYRQIRIAECDTDLQKIISRENPSSPLKHYQLRTVTYGLASAPFLATRALKQIAIDAAQHHPDVAVTIDECTYVDDIMTGADTLEEAQKIRDDLINVLSQYGLKLKKWKANDKLLLRDIPIEHWNISDKPFSSESHNCLDTVKVLGVSWNPANDTITFNVHLPRYSVHTKRTALSDASRLFDPVGWLAPVIIRMKIFVQQLWMKNLGWDDPLPDNLHTEWLTLREDLLDANSITIPRHIYTTRLSAVEIHGFSDASKLAYSAVVYLKSSMAAKPQSN